jgi:hypothetical protein
MLCASAVHSDSHFLESEREAGIATHHGTHTLREAVMVCLAAV